MLSKSKPPAFSASLEAGSEICPSPSTVLSLVVLAARLRDPIRPPTEPLEAMESTCWRLRN
eukprot:1156942-Rhodomonas_salina.2